MEHGHLFFIVSHENLHTITSTFYVRLCVRLVAYFFLHTLMRLLQKMMLHKIVQENMSIFSKEKIFLHGECT